VLRPGSSRYVHRNRWSPIASTVSSVTALYPRSLRTSSRGRSCFSGPHVADVLRAGCAHAPESPLHARVGGSFLVDLTVLVVAQRRPGAPEPMAGMFNRVCAQPGPHLGIGIVRGLGSRKPAIGGAGPPNGLARQPLRQLQGDLEHVHGAAAYRSGASNCPQRALERANP
jgi:hypothetical protein